MGERLMKCLCMAVWKTSGGRAARRELWTRHWKEAPGIEYYCRSNAPFLHKTFCTPIHFYSYGEALNWPAFCCAQIHNRTSQINFNYFPSNAPIMSFAKSSTVGNLFMFACSRLIILWHLGARPSNRRRDAELPKLCAPLIRIVITEMLGQGNKSSCQHSDRFYTSFRNEVLGRWTGIGAEHSSRPGNMAFWWLLILIKTGLK